MVKVFIVIFIIFWNIPLICAETSTYFKIIRDSKGGVYRPNKNYLNTYLNNHTKKKHLNQDDFTFQSPLDGGTSGGGSTLIFRSNGSSPVLLDFVLIQPYFLDDYSTNMSMLNFDHIYGIYRKKDFETITINELEIFKLVKERLDLWKTNSNKFIDLIYLSIENMSWNYFYHSTGAKQSFDYIIPSEIKNLFPNYSLKSSVIFKKGCGAWISAKEWNNTGNLTKAGIIIHEALRNIQTHVGNKIISNKFIQIMTALIMLEDPEEYKRLDDLIFLRSEVNKLISKMTPKCIFSSAVYTSNDFYEYGLQPHAFLYSEEIDFIKKFEQLFKNRKKNIIFKNKCNDTFNLMFDKKNNAIKLTFSDLAPLKFKEWYISSILYRTTSKTILKIQLIPVKQFLRISKKGIEHRAFREQTISPYSRQWRTYARGLQLDKEIDVHVLKIIFSANDDILSPSNQAFVYIDEMRSNINYTYEHYLTKKDLEYSFPFNKKSEDLEIIENKDLDCHLFDSNYSAND